MKGVVKRAYTLVEVLTVVVILGILVSIAYGGYAIVQAKNQKTQMQNVLDTLYGAIIRYHTEKGVWPDVFSGQDAYLINKDKLLMRAVLTKEERNLIENTLTMDNDYFLDIWGSRIRAYRSAKVLKDMDQPESNEARGVSNAGTFDLISDGADRFPGKPDKGENDDIMPRVQ